jgi:hypothetical protein
MTPRKKPSVVEGLAAGIERADIAGLGRGFGEGLSRLVPVVRVSEVWLPRGKFAVPQPCLVQGCVRGPFPSIPALRQHIRCMHAGVMRDGELSRKLDLARREATRQAMNGSAP